MKICTGRRCSPPQRTLNDRKGYEKQRLPILFRLRCSCVRLRSCIALIAAGGDTRAPSKGI